MEMSRLTRDGTAKPVLRGQILRREWGRARNIFPFQLSLSKNDKPDPYFTERYDLHTKGIKSSVDPKASCVQRTISYEIKSCE